MATVADLFVPLESGDRLTVEEFPRRYCARPDIRKAELVERVVYVASPVGPLHAEPHSAMNWWLRSYWVHNPDVRVMSEVSLRPGGENEVQPDVCMFRGGPESKVRLVRNRYIEGVPELVVEIAASSASHDLHDKLRAYERAGVAEYIVWQVYEQRIVWFRLRDGVYVRIEPDAAGVIESEVFPGLRLHVPAMLAGDGATVLAEVERRPADAGEA